MIEIGSVVTLKSGGPNMTVTDIDRAAGTAKWVCVCARHVPETGGYREDRFPLAALKKAKAREAQ